MLDGYKTKIVCYLTIAWAVIGFILGKIDANTAWQMILAAFGGLSIYDKIDRETEVLKNNNE